MEKNLYTNWILLLLQWNLLFSVNLSVVAVINRKKCTGKTWMSYYVIQIVYIIDRLNHQCNEVFCSDSIRFRTIFQYSHSIHIGSARNHQKRIYWATIDISIYISDVQTSLFNTLNVVSSLAIRLSDVFTLS